MSPDASRVGPTVVRFDPALDLALLVHRGRSDDAGDDAILHSLRVALRGMTPAERILGVLHATLDDAASAAERAFVREQVACMFGDQIAAALDAISRSGHGDESYAAYIQRIAGNALATTVKIRELEDHLTRRRRVHDPERARRIDRYRWARSFLKYKQEEHDEAEQHTDTGGRARAA